MPEISNEKLVEQFFLMFIHGSIILKLVMSQTNILVYVIKFENFDHSKGDGAES